MKLQMVGCSYRTAAVAVRERLAFDSGQAGAALDALRSRFPESEAVLLSTCNRTEFYTAAEDPRAGPTREDVARLVADLQHLPAEDVFGELFERSGPDAVRHLFGVAASLDSMVVGEPQILAQVKQAYELANSRQATGPLTHGAFQAAVRVARRIATETSIYQRRVSIPSIAVADFAREIFERFDDKQVLVIGAGEMAGETLRYLRDEGARHITVVNRSFQRAEELAAQWQGRAAPWERLLPLLAEADLVIGTTGASQPIVTRADYDSIESRREQRPLLALDLAVPRDFDPAIGDALGVYLYSINDLQAACERNRRERDRHLPVALAIVDEETARFMAELHHRSTAPIIRRLRQGWHGPKDEELARLFNKLPQLDEAAKAEIRQSFDRLVNKLLHPPLESLRSAAEHGPPHGLLEAIKRLFQLSD